MARYMTQPQNAESKILSSISERSTLLTVNDAVQVIPNRHKAHYPLQFVMVRVMEGVGN